MKPFCQNAAALLTLAQHLPLPISVFHCQKTIVARANC